MNLEKNILDLETYAIATMKKNGLRPENEKVKFAIFDSGAETSYFIYGYWSGADQNQKEWKLETLDFNCEELEAIKNEKPFGFTNKIDEKYIESTRAFLKNCDEATIKSEINSFFYAMKKAFEGDGEYNGNIIIVLTGKSKRSSTFFNYLNEKISIENNESLSFNLIRNATDILPDLEAEESRIQVQKRKNVFFKYYLGEKKGDKFSPFASLGNNKLGYSWKPVFDLPESDFPETVNLYFTTKADCMDGKHSADVIRHIPLRIQNIGKGERVFIRAAEFDGIYYAIAKDESGAEDKLRAIDEDPVVTLI